MNNPVTVATPAERKAPIVALRERLQAREGELRAALTDIPPEKFIRVVITAALINPDLQACDFSSLWLACMSACRDGLLPDGKEGALVPYKGRVSWIPMVEGLLRRFRRSGQFHWIDANVVRAGEEFHYFIDEKGPHFKHTPGGDSAAPIERIYAIATTKDGAAFVAVMTKAEADKIRDDMSKTTREDAPWKKHPTEMYKKTALRRITKLLPSARDLIEADDEEIAENVAAIMADPVERPIGPSVTAQLDQFAATDDAPRGGATDEQKS